MKNLKDFILEVSAELSKRAVEKQKQKLEDDDYLSNISASKFKRLQKRLERFKDYHEMKRNESTVGKFINTYLELGGSSKTLDTLTATEIKKYLSFVCPRPNCSFSPYTKDNNNFKLDYNKVINFLQSNKDTEIHLAFDQDLFTTNNYNRYYIFHIICDKNNNNDYVEFLFREKNIDVNKINNKLNISIGGVQNKKGYYKDNQFSKEYYNNKYK